MSENMAKVGRNDPCPCGSGKKYKKCCLSKDEVAHRQASAAAALSDERYNQLVEASNAVADLVDAGKLDDAEYAAQALVERWPDVHDGYDCLGMVCQARGDKRQAAEYYRKVITFARKEPSLYDLEFEDYYQDLIARLDPAARMGALPPHPRDI